MRAFVFLIPVVVACGSSGSDGAGGVSSGGAGGSSGGGGAGGAGGSTAGLDCNTSPCGGDVLGAWTLADYCAPSGITVPSDTITFFADGTYDLGSGVGTAGGTGTWSVSGNELTTNGVTGEYCVQGNTLWSQYGTSKGALVKLRTRIQ